MNEDLVLRKLNTTLSRSEQLTGLYVHIDQSYAAIDSDDILRASVVTSMSGFDLFIHDIYRVTVQRCVELKLRVKIKQLPWEALIVEQEQQRLELIDEAIKEANSHKSFMQPDKVADLFRAFFDSPWDYISEFSSLNKSDLRRQLKSYADWRNRIVHEADINPALGGIKCWDMHKPDVVELNKFLRELGESIVNCLNHWLSSAKSNSIKIA